MSAPDSDLFTDGCTIRYVGGGKPGEPCMAATIVALDDGIIEWLARPQA